MTSSRNRNEPIRGISKRTSDSTTAIGHTGNEGPWLELGPDAHDAHIKGESMRTMDFDVTSLKEGEAKQSRAATVDMT